MVLKKYMNKNLKPRNDVYNKIAQKHRKGGLRRKSYECASVGSTSEESDISRLSSIDEGSTVRSDTGYHSLGSIPEHARHRMREDPLNLSNDSTFSESEFSAGPLKASFSIEESYLSIDPPHKIFGHRMREDPLNFSNDSFGEKASHVSSDYSAYMNREDSLNFSSADEYAESSIIMSEHIHPLMSHPHARHRTRDDPMNFSDDSFAEGSILSAQPYSKQKAPTRERMVSSTISYGRVREDLMRFSTDSYGDDPLLDIQIDPPAQLEDRELSVESFRDDSPRSERPRGRLETIDSLREGTPSPSYGGSVFSSFQLEKLHRKQTLSKIMDENSTRNTLSNSELIISCPNRSHMRQKSIEISNDVAFQAHYEAQLLKHFRSIFMEKKFPRPDLTAANPTTCLAGVQALSEILPFFYRPTPYGLIQYFYGVLGKDLFRSVHESELEELLKECAAKDSNPDDPNDSQLKAILEGIFEARDPSIGFTRAMLDIMLKSNLPRSDMSSIVVDYIAPTLSGDEMIQIYKALPFVIPDLIQQLPLQKQDELFFEEQSPEHKALFLKKLGSRANKLNPLIEKFLFSDEAIPFIASLIKNQVILRGIVFPVSEVEDALVSEKFWSPDMWGSLLKWEFDGPIQPCFVEQCRMDLALSDGREDTTGLVDLPRLEESFHPNDLVWMQLQTKTKYPHYFDGTTNPEKRLHARYMYDACVRHIQSTVDLVLAHDGDIGRIVTDFLFPLVDFSNQYLSPNVEFWTSEEVLLWWNQYLPPLCREHSWMINDCRISGRDLYHIDEGLLRQMELPHDVASYVLQAIDDLRYNKSIRVLKQHPSINIIPSNSRASADSLDTWTTDDVLKWWKTALPQRCQKYLRAVRECRFEGKDLRVLDDQVLSTLGMKKLLRLKVLKALKVLRSAHSPKQPPRRPTMRKSSERYQVVKPLKLRTKQSKGPRRHSLLPQSRSVPVVKPFQSQRSSSVPILYDSRKPPRFLTSVDPFPLEKEVKDCLLCKKAIPV